MENEIMNEQKFKEIKEKMERVFNCEVEKIGSTVIKTRILGTPIKMDTGYYPEIYIAEYVPEDLSKADKKVLKSAEKYLYQLIKQVLDKTADLQK